MRIIKINICFRKGIVVDKLPLFNLIIMRPTSCLSYGCFDYSAIFLLKSNQFTRAITRFEDTSSSHCIDTALLGRKISDLF